MHGSRHCLCRFCRRCRRCRSSSSSSGMCASLEHGTAGYCPAVWDLPFRFRANVYKKEKYFILFCTFDAHTGQLSPLSLLHLQCMSCKWCVFYHSLFRPVQHIQRCCAVPCHVGLFCAVLCCAMPCCGALQLWGFDHTSGQHTFDADISDAHLSYHGW